MRFYCAAAAVEIERAKKVIAALRGAGHTCTHDWTVQVEEEMRLYPDRKETELPDEICAMHARADLDGVRDADFYVLVAPNGRGRGSWVELGYALAVLDFVRNYLQKQHAYRIYVIGPYARDSIFTRLATTILQGEDDKALDALLLDLALDD